MAAKRKVIAVGSEFELLRIDSLLNVTYRGVGFREEQRCVMFCLQKIKFEFLAFVLGFARTPVLATQPKLEFERSRERKSENSKDQIPIKKIALLTPKIQTFSH